MCFEYRKPYDQMIWSGSKSQLEGDNILKTTNTSLHLNQLLTTSGKKTFLKQLLNKYCFYSVIGFLQVQSIQHVIVLSKVENTDVTYVTNVKNKSSILLSPKVRTYISAYENIHKNTA